MNNIKLHSILIIPIYMFFFILPFFLQTIRNCVDIFSVSFVISHTSMFVLVVRFVLKKIHTR